MRFHHESFSISLICRLTGSQRDGYSGLLSENEGGILSSKVIFTNAINTLL